MDKLFIVENYNTCEYEAFNDLAEANMFVRQYYIDNIQNLLSYDLNSKEALEELQNDLENLLEEKAFILDTMYIHEANYHI